MGAVDTTYTFTATDTITSSKMNNIIDQTTITTDAIIGTTLDVASGKLKIRSAGITSNEMGSASVTQTALAPNVVGNGPAFRAFASTATSLSNNVVTKVDLLSENFDTNSNFASSRFTPTVAGYYQINCTVYSSAAPQFLQVQIHKNGSVYSGAVHTNAQTFASNVSDLVYCNGTTDYIEMYAIQASGGTVNLTTGTEGTYMSGCLIRSA